MSLSAARPISLGNASRDVRIVVEGRSRPAFCHLGDLPLSGRPSPTGLITPCEFLLRRDSTLAYDADPYDLRVGREGWFRQGRSRHPPFVPTAAAKPTVRCRLVARRQHTKAVRKLLLRSQAAQACATSRSSTVRMRRRSAAMLCRSGSSRRVAREGRQGDWRNAVACRSRIRRPTSVRGLVAKGADPWHHKGGRSSEAGTAHRSARSTMSAVSHPARRQECTRTAEAGEFTVDHWRHPRRMLKSILSGRAWERQPTTVGHVMAAGIGVRGGVVSVGRVLPVLLALLREKAGRSTRCSTSMSTSGPRSWRST